MRGGVFGLVLGALRARREQTIALFVLTVLAGLGASAAPWFAGWARDAVKHADFDSAPAQQLVVTAVGPVRFSPTGPSPVASLRERVGDYLTVPGAEVAVGARLYATVGNPGSEAGVYLNYRDGVCAQLILEGACPEAPGQVVLGRATAEAIGVGIGDPVKFVGFRLPGALTLTVSGLYDVADLLSPYWAGTDLLSGPATTLGSTVDDPAFTSEATLLAAGPDGLDMDVHLTLPERAFDATLAATLARATGQLRQDNFEVRTQVPALIDQIERDRRLVALGVLVAAAQLVLLCWVGLFLAVRHTAEERRADIGLLKLRGAAPWRIWALAAQQSALPMLAGALVGWLLGYVGAAVLARTWIDLSSVSFGQSLAAVGLACLGALAAAVVAEWRSLGAPVVSLLRRVPGGHRGWRADVIDLVVVLLALVGVVQGHLELSGDGEPSVLALLAPALVGLAVALLVARALPVASARAGASALRTGRAGSALAWLHLARRPGTNRVFTVLAVTVSVFATVALSWNTAAQAWSQRAAQELGAARVLTVRALGAADLMRAVHEVDPDGRYAMAVARTEGLRTEDRVVAVDTSRLAAVADPAVLERAGVGSAEHIADLLHPPRPVQPSIVDGNVELEAASRADGPVNVRLHLSTMDGRDRTVDFGPIGANRTTFRSVLSGCPAPGCRLVAVELVAPRLITEGLPATVEVYRLGGADTSLLTDMKRWRPPLGPVGIGLVTSTLDDHLSLSLYTGPKPPGQRLDPRALVNAAPAPLPIVLAGPRPEQRRAGDDRIIVLGGARVAYRVVGDAPVLPRVGDVGALVDLEYSIRSNDAPGESAALEVWLTRDAPESVLTGLRERGIRILAEDTVEATAARLADQGPGVALRFELFAAIILLLLGAGTLVVAATVERRVRVEELRALGAQGLSSADVRRAGYTGPAALVALALVTGLAAAGVARLSVTAALPVFSDRWLLLPVPTAGFVTIAGATLAALLLLGSAAAIGAAHTVNGATEGRS